MFVALQIGDDGALAIHVLDTSGDEADRVPHQINKGVPQPFVDPDRLGRPDQLRGNVLLGITDDKVRTPIRQPPMLVPEVSGKPEVRLKQHVRCRHATGAARPWRGTFGGDGEVARDRIKGVQTAARIGAERIADDKGP